MNQDFANKVVLVTGAAGGIGQAAAEIFARRGASVAVVDINGVGAEETAAAIRKAGDKALALQADLTSEAAVGDVISKTVSAFGGLQCAFNNAGVNSPMFAFHEMDLAEWNRMMEVNLTAVFLCMKHELAHMVKNGGGAIVNTGSAAGLIAAPGMPHYTAAKHGVLGLTKVAAQEYAARGIRVNAICPGSTDTPMMRRFIGDSAEMAAAMAKTTPVGRLAKAEEVAEAAVWLCSDAARFVSGESLVVDAGGLSR